MKEILLGDKAEYKRIFTDEDVRKFAIMSEDDNPIHLDNEYATKSRFGKRIVHGILVSSLISKIIGTQLPGEGSIYMEQELKFLKPVYIGEEIKGIVEVIEKIQGKNIYILDTRIVNSEEEIVLRGMAKVMYGKDNKG